MIYAGIQPRQGETLGVLVEHEATEGYLVRRTLSVAGKLSDHPPQFAAVLLEEQVKAFLRRNAEFLDDERGRRAAMLRLRNMGADVENLDGSLTAFADGKATKDDEEFAYRHLAGVRAEALVDVGGHGDPLARAWRQALKADVWAVRLSEGDTVAESRSSRELALGTNALLSRLRTLIERRALRFEVPPEELPEALGPRALKSLSEPREGAGRILTHDPALAALALAVWQEPRNLVVV